MSTLIDAPIRVAFRAAHAMLRAYWFVRRPSTSGALVAVWYEGRVLLVKNSYRKEYTLPGGYVRPGEAAEAAAARELREEVGIEVAPESLTHAYRGEHRYENRQDRLDIYECEVTTRPVARIDRREVVWADLQTPAQVRARPVVPHLLAYLDERASR